MKRVETAEAELARLRSRVPPTSQELIDQRAIGYAEGQASVASVPHPQEWPSTEEFLKTMFKFAQARGAWSFQQAWDAFESEVTGLPVSLPVRPTPPAEQEILIPNREREQKRQTCRHQYWDLGYCIDCGIHSNDPLYSKQTRQRAAAEAPPPAPAAPPQE